MGAEKKIVRPSHEGLAYLHSLPRKECKEELFFLFQAKGGDRDQSPEFPPVREGREERESSCKEGIPLYFEGGSRIRRERDSPS